MPLSGTPILRQAQDDTLAAQDDTLAAQDDTLAADPLDGEFGSRATARQIRHVAEER